jgi:hypothetical protein
LIQPTSRRRAHQDEVEKEHGQEHPAEGGDGWMRVVQQFAVVLAVVEGEIERRAGAEICRDANCRAPASRATTTTWHFRLPPSKEVANACDDGAF